MTDPLKAETAACGTEPGNDKAAEAAGDINHHHHHTAHGKTVVLNVGGKVYEISRSALEMYPRTMLARLVSKEWSGNNTDNNQKAIFIDRNGDRFKYVLDYMRDGQVSLPVLESVGAVRQELEYFGFDNVRTASIQAATLEGGRVIANMAGNMHEELDALQKENSKMEKMIEHNQHRMGAIRLAHILFLRAAAATAKGDQVVCVRLVTNDDKRTARDAIKCRSVPF